jgi:RNA polymerase sigma-70 factor (ECF subfamily)
MPEPDAFSGPHAAAGLAEQGMGNLLRRVLGGDADAFEAIYRAHVGRVFAVCLRMSGERRRAEELTQDVFVRAWERIATFRGESSLGSWLHRLTVNVVLEDARSEQRRAARVSSSPDPAQQEQAGEAERGAFGPETAIDLERAIASLPAGARRVFVLHDIEGYRHGEIAELTGAAEGSVRAQLFRARRLLMEALGR